MSFRIKNSVTSKVVETKTKEKPKKEPEKMKFVEEELVFDEKHQKWKLLKKSVIPSYEE